MVFSCLSVRQFEGGVARRLGVFSRLLTMQIQFINDFSYAAKCQLKVKVESSRTRSRVWQAIVIASDFMLILKEVNNLFNLK